MVKRTGKILAFRARRAPPRSRQRGDELLADPIGEPDLVVAGAERDPGGRRRGGLDEQDHRVARLAPPDRVRGIAIDR